MTTRVAIADVETEGNKVSTSFHLPADKSIAVRCWLEAVKASGLDDKVLASDVNLSKGRYSKIANGDGDLLGLVYRVGRKHPDIRHDFMCRLYEAEGGDAVDTAAEQLVFAALRFIRLRSNTAIPSKARMAKADVAAAAKAVGQ